ncbi:MAG: CopD family protein [Candidatus Sedimenticola sp. (ex Thyasira tokunagai)]
MLWVKAGHLIFLISWYVGLFYLPRLFVHHAMSEDSATRERLEIMERKLFWFVTPWALLTIILGFVLAWSYGWTAFEMMHWLQLKIFLVAILIGYHVWCWKLMLQFRNSDSNPHSHVWFRWFNEFPLLILVATVLLVVLKPF